MPDGSRLLLLEMVVPPGNTPAYAKLLDLLMSAGFSMKRIVPTASAISIIEATPG